MTAKKTFVKAAFELQSSCAFEKPNKYLQQLVIVYQEWSAWHWLAANVVKEINLQTNWNNLKVTLKNSWHFATPPLASWRSDVWGTSTETQYSWHVTTMIWLVLLIGWHNLFSWNKQSEPLKSRSGQQPSSVSVILLQIVMVSPGTHLVKNQESQSRTNDSQFKKRWIPKLKMLGSLCNQSIKNNIVFLLFKAQKRL